MKCPRCESEGYDAADGWCRACGCEDGPPVAGVVLGMTFVFTFLVVATVAILY